ncbi:MAG: alpha-galactosidase [Sphaerochaetaceae bacterium]
MKATRICIIGGGSRLWAIQFFKDLAYNTMTHGTLVLYDIDKAAARRNVDVADRVFAVNESAGRFIVSAEDDLGKALEGCDLVIISIEPGRTDCRYGDLVLPEEYGILESVGDTTGPGGMMRARRAIPLFVDFAQAIATYCPDAWVINYTNPMTLCTAALFEGFPKIKALGCCHEVFHTEDFLAELVGKWFDVPKPDRRDIHVDITGVNHFTFVTKAFWDGHDLMPRLRELADDPATYSDRTDVAKRRLGEEKWFDCDHLVALSLLRDFGALGAAGDRHLAEFVPWYLASDEQLWRFGVVRTPYEWRIRQAKEKHDKVFADEELKATLSDEEGVDIMRSLMGDRTLFTNINRPNEGQISFLPKGRIVESNGFISRDSIRPVVSSDPPLGIMNLIRRVSDVQKMTLDAVVSGDDDALFAAFLSDPLMNLSHDKASELFEKMLDASKLVY